MDVFRLISVLYKFLEQITMPIYAWALCLEAKGETPFKYISQLNCIAAISKKNYPRSNDI